MKFQDAFCPFWGKVCRAMESDENLPDHDSRSCWHLDMVPYFARRTLWDRSWKNDSLSHHQSRDGVQSDHTGSTLISQIISQRLVALPQTNWCNWFLVKLMWTGWIIYCGVFTVLPGKIWLDPYFCVIRPIENGIAFQQMACMRCRGLRGQPLQMYLMQATTRLPCMESSLQNLLNS